MRAPRVFDAARARLEQRHGLAEGAWPLGSRLAPHFFFPWLVASPVTVWDEWQLERLAIGCGLCASALLALDAIADGDVGGDAESLAPHVCRAWQVEEDGRLLMRDAGFPGLAAEWPHVHRVIAAVHERNARRPLDLVVCRITYRRDAWDRVAPHRLVARHVLGWESPARAAIAEHVLRDIAAAVQWIDDLEDAADDHAAGRWNPVAAIAATHGSAAVAPLVADRLRDVAHPLASSAELARRADLPALAAFAHELATHVDAIAARATRDGS